MARRHVAGGMATGAVATVATLGIAYAVGSWRTPEERLASAVTACLVLAGWLAACIGRVAALRFASADAIDAARTPDTADARVRMAQAVLQNTLEQVVLAAPVYLALAMLTEHGNATLATLVALFSAGRVLFWTGYAGGAGTRALGFALTFYPTVIVLAGLIVQQVLRLFS